jgi:hypothetical protein
MGPGGLPDGWEQEEVRQRVLHTIRAYRWTGLALGFWPMEPEFFAPLIRGFWSAATTVIVLTSLGAQLAALVVQTFGNVDTSAKAIFADNVLGLQVLNVGVRIVLYYFLRMRVFGKHREETVRVLADQAGRASQALLLIVMPTVLVLIGVVAAQFNDFITARVDRSSTDVAQTTAAQGLVAYSTITILFWDTAPAFCVAVFAVMAQRATAYVRDYLQSLAIASLPEAEDQFQRMNKELQEFSSTWSTLVVLVDFSFVVYVASLILLLLESRPLFPTWLDITLLVLKILFLVLTNVMAMRVTEAAREIYPTILRIYRGPGGLSFAFAVRALEERGRLGFHVAGVPVTQENLSRAVYLIAIGLFYIFHEASANSKGGLFG